MLVGVKQCLLCPQRCPSRTKRGDGFCGASTDLEVSSICIHTGEEPPLCGTNPLHKGIVNVFFPHCNLHCIYCQNYEISGKKVEWKYLHYYWVDDVADRIAELLPQSAGLLGFVTPTHYADRLGEIVDAVRLRGFNPTVVYNTSGFETVETLRQLEGLVDIYLPDFKYADDALAMKYSHALYYRSFATDALLEMQRQVGSKLKCDDDGVAYRGMIIRHLVLPGHVENSIACLDWLAEHMPLDIHLSLMAQYYPPKDDLPEPLNRTLTRKEYLQVVTHFYDLGFQNGWVQELSSESCYRPHFESADHPFDS